MPYEPKHIEPRWQATWEANVTFVATEDRSRPKFYALDMFPYPSGKGLHVGHPVGYTASDIVSRHKRHLGFNVLHPIGYDAFGLPAEQRAIEEGVPPQVSTAESITNFRRQLKRLGYSYDWSREVSTANPDYYKWTQWIFTKLVEKGLAYQADAWVNWCAALGTVLANDEVIDGKSERGGHPVVRMQMRQWMLRITAYAERLLAGLDRIDWPEGSKTRQREHIGKSEGAHIRFNVAGSTEVLEVFTTRPDTLFGATFLVVAPEHPVVARITTAAQRAAVEAYQAAAASRSEKDRQANKEKSGVDTGARVVHPGTGQPLPVWIADYVLYGYGTGAIMAVPAHDERDHAFATAFGLPIVEVITGGDVTVAAWPGEGTMKNSGRFDGLASAEGKRAVIAWLEAEGRGQGAVTWRLHDWIFARQRYWGEPIPVLKDGDEVVRALGVDELPVELPPVADYRPTGTGKSPLVTARAWVEVDDPKTGRKLQREVDTMPGSAGSSWYFLRYCDPHNPDELCAREKSDYWMPVDLYVGGPEHLIGHLMYARMWQMFLHDLGVVRDSEPFRVLRHQGMLQGLIYRTPDKRVVPLAQVEERDGKAYLRGTDIELTVEIGKMSKRWGNVVNPDDVIDTYGADALRVYICFMGPFSADKPWQSNQMEAQYNFLRRFWRLYMDDEDHPRVTEPGAGPAPTEAQLRTLHKTIQKVGADIEGMSFNTAISALHVAVRDLGGCTAREVLEPLVILLSPFAPHLAEELWVTALGRAGGIAYVPWPAFDPALATDDLVTIGVQVNGKLRGEVKLRRDEEEATAVEAGRAAVERQLAGKEVVKVIYKAGRILSFIVKDA